MEELSLPERLGCGSKHRLLIADVAPALIDAFKVDGKMWQVPHSWNNMVIYYNTKMFKDAKIDPPKETCSVAIAELQAHGVVVKVITGEYDPSQPAEFMEQAANGDFAQVNRKLVKDQILHHGSGPQCKRKLQLERVLRGHDIKDLLLLCLAQRWLFARYFLVLEAFNTRFFISFQPLIHS